MRGKKTEKKARKGMNSKHFHNKLKILLAPFDLALPRHIDVHNNTNSNRSNKINSIPHLKLSLFSPFQFQSGLNGNDCCK